MFFLFLGIVLMIISLTIILATFSMQRFAQETAKWVSVWLGLFLIFLLGFYFVIDAMSSSKTLIAFGLAGLAAIFAVGGIARK